MTSITGSIAIISIHAPRAGSDVCIRTTLDVRTYFNPRSPCGERHMFDKYAAMIKAFQSTLPVRGATGA